MLQRNCLSLRTIHNYVTFDKLVCFGRKYTCESLASLPDPINPRNTSELSNEDTILFGGPNSQEHPFCNWKRLNKPLKYEGVCFPTSEHAYLYQQALFAKDDVASNNILSSTDPADAKQFSHKIQNLNKTEWNKGKREIMKNILRIKFKEKEMGEQLLASGDKNIHESGRDTFWATGVSLSHKNAMVKEGYNGDSILGKLLMEIRGELKEK